jgi:hypothetical protein
MGCKLAGNAMRRVASAFALSASSKVPSGHTFDTRTLFHSASWGKPRFGTFTAYQAWILLASDCDFSTTHCRRHDLA